MLPQGELFALFFPSNQVKTQKPSPSEEVTAMEDFGKLLCQHQDCAQRYIRYHLPLEETAACGIFSARWGRIARSG